MVVSNRQLWSDGNMFSWKLLFNFNQTMLKTHRKRRVHYNWIDIEDRWNNWIQAASGREAANGRNLLFSGCYAEDVSSVTGAALHRWVDKGKANGSHKDEINIKPYSGISAIRMKKNVSTRSKMAKSNQNETPAQEREAWYLGKNSIKNWINEG